MARFGRFLFDAWDLAVFVADVATLPFRARGQTPPAGEIAQLTPMTMVDVYRNAVGLRPAGE
jgi:hypothetical protein